MSKTRLAAGTVLVLVAVMIAATASVGATARPTAAQGTVKRTALSEYGRPKKTGVKLGFITKFPVSFYFTLVNGAKSWQKSHPGVSVTYAQGKSATDDAGEIAAIQDLVAASLVAWRLSSRAPASPTRTARSGRRL